MLIISFNGIFGFNEGNDAQWLTAAKMDFTPQTAFERSSVSFE